MVYSATRLHGHSGDGQTDICFDLMAGLHDNGLWFGRSIGLVPGGEDGYPVFARRHINERIPSILVGDHGQKRLALGILERHPYPRDGGFVGLRLAILVGILPHQAENESPLGRGRGPG